MAVQAARAPHADISQREAETAAHMCEHLLHQARVQRGTLRTLCASLLQLRSQAATLGSLASHPTARPQV